MSKAEKKIVIRVSTVEDLKDAYDTFIEEGFERGHKLNEPKLGEGDRKPVTIFVRKDV